MQPVSRQRLPTPRLMNYIVTYRPVAKRWLCKRRSFLGNARNIHARNNRKTMLCNPFLSNGSVNTRLQQGYCWKWCFLFGTCKVVIRKTIGGDSVQFRVESPAVKKRVSCKSAAVKRRLHVCCSYSETAIITVLKSVARMWLVKTEKT
jgi:hypothetical protein